LIIIVNFLKFLLSLPHLLLHGYLFLSQSLFETRSVMRRRAADLLLSSIRNHPLAKQRGLHTKGWGSQTEQQANQTMGCGTRHLQPDPPTWQEPDKRR
jgi:hypothetical protein